jgi:transposase
MIRLTDDQWGRIRQHFPEEHIPDGRAGRKPIPTRRVLEAALWILNTGAQWHMLPQSYPNYKTVHRRRPGPIDEANAACFIVKDHNGHALAYDISRTTGRRSAAKLLTKDEAQRMAANFR